ncbi:hypothetical protein A2630_02235 [Candidatus Woesebacteria bacterium RIFCSPHIGHO2_01_FULL_44_10]|uniref:Phospholipase C/D domain-containing protein n=1 Tax=Candidatus Woesebacteria bacterium RIFCSPLOWO2_01_FULL_44_14 TaxID=1802525 RepID=A0A1F8C0S2_9BACT|nr:MAG: hypothetical protein A2630_02235 [Candidatus Woesebacteria bacterium RIFCSPHIGHO2_01_FULL_44_10]OGM53959.1 MAG: hypothetical protein A3F62_00105 [Candidatus Woesebacteria bacterium RIFCSPHIGHO2_12_FULL_44_11]OGM69927.1 MAG: hypothetical protein A2975_04945 [Candidatus Woesebacteria bacterium RIFCSPLOWO2_01_FULL_44_14]
MLQTAQEILNTTLQNGLLASEIGHGAFAIPAAAFLWKKTKSWRSILAFYLVVYFIDLDHLVEYFQVYGLHFDLIEFFRLDFFRVIGQAKLPFHAWEWVIGLVYLTRKKKWNYIPKIIMLGIAAHLLWDTIDNGFPPAFYFILHRISTGFILPPH